MFTRFSKYLMVAVLAGIAASCTPGITDNSVCTDSTASNFQKPGQCEHNKPAIVSPSMGASIPATGPLTSVHFEATASVDWTLDGQAMITAKAFDRDIAVGPHTSCITGGTCSSFTVSAPTVRFTVHTQDGKPCGPMMARIEGKVPADSAIFVDTSDGCQVAWPSMFGNEDSVLVDIHGLSGKYFRLVKMMTRRNGATPLSKEVVLFAGLRQWNGQPINFDWAYTWVVGADGNSTTFLPKSGGTTSSISYDFGGFLPKSGRPMKVALNYDGSILPLETDSIVRGLRLFEKERGFQVGELFQIVNYSDLPVVNGKRLGFEIVRKDTSISFHAGGFGNYTVGNDGTIVAGRLLLTQNATSGYLVKVVEHETGHMVGYNHDQEPGGLMQPTWSSTMSITPREKAHMEWYESMRERALAQGLWSGVIAPNVQGWRLENHLPLENTSQIQ